jgi:hypothetical protein
MKPTVFLSQPSALADYQRQIRGRWQESLNALGFSVEQLRRESYLADPWCHLMRFFASCDGVVVLGFRQLTVHQGKWRRGTAEEANVRAFWTSPWLHTEAGMALASQLPVLVAPESAVSEGIFASDTWTGQLRGTSAEAPDSRVLKHWAVAVEAQHNRRTTQLESHGDIDYSLHRYPGEAFTFTLQPGGHATITTPSGQPTTLCPRGPGFHDTEGLCGA